MTAFHLTARLPVVALLLAATVAPGQTASPTVPAPATTAGAKPAKALKVLNEADLRPAQLLPSPPLPGSAGEADDLATVRRAVAAATPEQLARARYDDAHEDPTIFDAAIGGGFEAKKLPATWALLTLVQNEGDVAAGFAKKYFHRTRPWALDPTLPFCDAHKPSAQPATSYPSGHATLGYSVGLMLASLLPEKAAIIETRAREYAGERVICGVHYASDIEASHVVAAFVTTRLLTAPAVQPMIAAARAELQQAHFTGG